MYVRRLAIAITSLALGILFSEGWQGPTSVTVATTLPHHMKSFAMSQYAAITYLISPAASNIMGIYLTVRTPRKPTFRVS